MKPPHYMQPHTPKAGWQYSQWSVGREALCYRPAQMDQNSGSKCWWPRMKCTTSKHCAWLAASNPRVWVSVWTCPCVCVCLSAWVREWMCPCMRVCPRRKLWGGVCDIVYLSLHICMAREICTNRCDSGLGHRYSPRWCRHWRCRR